MYTEISKKFAAGKKSALGMRVLWIFILFWMLAGFFPDFAAAQIIDDIVLAPADNGAVVAKIKLNAAVQYLRHAPPSKGQMLEIYYRVLLSGGARDAWPDETRKSPPSDLIPGFTVTAQNKNTQEPKLVFQFSRPEEFSVRVGNKARSFEVTLRPIAGVADTLDMGEIKMLSALGEPLDAEIDLPGAGKSEKAALSARMASPELFKSLGVNYSDLLPKLLFRIEARADGEPYIKVTSSEAVNEPLVNLLVQLSGPSGKLIREYTLLPSLPGNKQEPRLAAETKTVADKMPVAKTPEQKAAGATPLAQPQKVVEAATPATQPAPAPTEQNEDTDKQAEALMAKGRDAMQRGDHGIAIEAFNKLLLLAPNKSTQDAQEAVGMARENAGQNFKAKLEYELYLKTYTSGDGVARVKARLAKLGAPQPAQLAEKTEPTAASKEKQEFQLIKYGSLSVYYYHGASHTEIPASGATARPFSLTTTDQSMLLTNANATLRMRNNVFDNRLVFQDAYNKNFLPGKVSSNKLNALYFDLKNRAADYSARVGRQSSSGGGVMGRFDGATAGYGLTPKWHVNAVAGQLAEFTANSKPVFYGASLDMGIFKERWGGSLYTIKQTVDGVTDRKAIGAEMRYFGAGNTLFAMLDYDTAFSAVNIALLQGTLNNGRGTTWNFMVDQRKTPSLSIRNALNGAMVTSVSGLLQNGWLETDIRDLAKARTATATTMQVGVSRQVRENWQVGGDISLSRTSGLPASGTLLPDGTTGTEGFQAASASTGPSKTLTGQVVGSNLFSQRDVTVFSLSLTRSPTVRGQSYVLSNRSVVHEKWTLDSSLRLYWQNDSAGGKENIVTPTFKLSYQAKEKLSLEAEAGIEMSNNTPASGMTTKTDRKYFSLGFRGDF